MPAAPPTTDPRIADLVAAGRVRAGLFPPQFRKDAATGEITGPWIEVIRTLGAHIGVPVAVTELSTPDALIGALASGACDVGSLGFDPQRADKVGGFSTAFMQVDYTCLVPANSAIGSLADVDRPGVRIAAVKNHASTLVLRRLIKRAEEIGAPTPDAAFALLRSGTADAWASIRPTLAEYALQGTGSRVLPGSYGVNRPALVVPKGAIARLAFISEFIEQARASGLLQRAVERAGQAGYEA